MKRCHSILIMVFLICTRLEAESARVFIVGKADISPDRPEGASVSLSYTDSVLVSLGGDLRFYRGIQLDLTAPPRFPAVGAQTLATVLYSDLEAVPEPEIADIEGKQLFLEVLPAKIINTWQIPLRFSHGFRNSPYITIPTGVIPPSSFPLVFRLMPVIKGISGELETMTFDLRIRPILGDEGLISISFNYPEQLPDRPIIVLIDDELIPNPTGELLLKEGEHHLVILSDDYRNHSRRFMVERAKHLGLSVELQDLTPLLLFEYPEGAEIFVDSRRVSDLTVPYPVEPGPHEVRFQMSNYSVIRPVNVQKGKTYRIALSVDINITEND